MCIRDKHVHVDDVELHVMHTHYTDTISVGLACPTYYTFLILLSFNTETKSSSRHIAVTNNYMYSKHTMFPHILGNVTNLIKSIIKVFLVLFHKWLDQPMIDNHRAIVGHW